MQIEISPHDNTYTVTETGSVNQITCTAMCNPNCTTSWTGPNLPAGSTSILNLQNIDRNQAGVYSCTAVNDISSLALIKVNVIVNCKYEMSRLFDIWVIFKNANIPDSNLRQNQHRLNSILIIPMNSSTLT